MQSISHWGQFEMQAPGTENFREQLNPLKWDSIGPNYNYRAPDKSIDYQYDAKYLHKFY